MTKPPDERPPTGRYDASSITVLPGLEAVRQRPGMYIGAADAQGLHRLVGELLENAVDESLAGHCRRILVEVGEDGSCLVEDDGRGIPVDPHPLTGRPASEVVLTTLHAGGKFRPGTYGLSGGLHGTGVSCVNALAEWLVVDIWREGHHHRQRFSRGVPDGDVERIGPSDRQGTAIRFLPDPEIFGAASSFDIRQLAETIEEMAFLNPGISISFRAPGRTEEHKYDGGVVSYVEHLDRDRRPLHARALHIGGGAEGVEVDVAFRWSSAFSEDIRSYVNSIRTLDGGSHVDAMRSALVAVISDLAAQQHGFEPEDGIHALDVMEGLTCVLSVRAPDPEFEGQTKGRLRSSGVGQVVEDVLRVELHRILAGDPVVASAIVGRVVEATVARRAARRASERARYNPGNQGFSEEVYREQFGIRSKNWHESAAWITDDELLAAQAASCRMGPDARMLDVCCGTGVVGAAFDGRVDRKIGLDLTPEMRALASERLDEVDAGTVYDLPYGEGDFDLVVTREVLHILSDPEKAVSEIFRVLRPGGQFIVGHILPYGPEDAAWMWRIFKKKQPLLFSMFQDDDFVALLKGAGFGEIEMSELGVWESIDTWIDTHETSNVHRHEIRRLYYEAPAAVRAVHPFEILPSGEIRDLWRWCIFSAIKPTE